MSRVASRTIRVLVLAALAAPSFAIAETPVDTVFLKDGGRVKGSIMTEDAKTGVSIRLADGTTKQIAAAAIDRVVYGDEAARSAAAVASAPPPADGPTVHLESDDPAATLDLILSQAVYAGYYTTVSGSEWTTICTIPCGKRVDKNRQYRIGGLGLNSGNFTLPSDRDEVRLRVQSGSAGGFIGGLLLFSFGISGLITGGTLLGVGASVDDDSLATPGMIITLVSVPMTVGGVYLWQSSATRVVDETDRQIVDAAEGDPGLSPAAGATGLGYRASF